MGLFGFSRWKSKNGKDDNGGSLTLSDVIRGLQHCVNASQEIVEQHTITSINKFLDKDDKPITRTVKVGENGAMDLPLICLAGHNYLSLDELEVKLDVYIKNSDLKEAKIPHKDGDSEIVDGGDAAQNVASITRSAFIVDVCNVKSDDDKTHMRMTLKFASKEPHEAISRIVETLNNSMHAYPIERSNAPDDGAINTQRSK
jgi:hypothetical protein